MPTTRSMEKKKRGTAQFKTKGIQTHPIFAPDKFSPELDYKGAFQEAALLASRLLKSQQSYHWLFALCFGTNKQSRVPWEFKNKCSPNVPEEYTTNRGIGELTQEEVGAVDKQLTALSQRVRIVVPVAPFPKQTTRAQCQPGKVEKGQQGCPSTILIGRNLYNSMIQSGGHQPSSERAWLLFGLANTLLHEMAHAAHFHIMGPRRPEDFFEDALVNEAGFDYESRIYGILATTWRNSWVQWQNITFLVQTSYPANRKCRNSKKLSMYSISRPIDMEFAKRLLSDEWWDGADSAEDRSLHLVPDFLRNNENANLLATAPASFRRWLRRMTSGVQNTPRHQHETTRTPLQIRQPTPSTGTTLGSDHHSTFDGRLLCFERPPFPKSAEDIRSVIPTNGGIIYAHLYALFIRKPCDCKMEYPDQIDEIDKLALEVCRYDQPSRSYVLRETEIGALYLTEAEIMDEELDGELNEVLDNMMDEEMDEMVHGVPAGILDWALDEGNAVDKMDVC